MSVNDFPDEREELICKQQNIGPEKMPQGCSTKTYIFPLLVVKVITRKLWGRVGGGLSFYASVFCSVECVEPGEFSSHTTP